MWKFALYAAIFAAPLSAGVAKAAPICLRTQDMTETQPAKDGASITFKMRDGSVWRNDLQGSCPDLGFDLGFVWNVRNGDGTVCENEESLHVLRSAEICVLGEFTELKPSRAEQHRAR
jgi:hypothetical protein